jgi:hypothetical protein
MTVIIRLIIAMLFLSWIVWLNPARAQEEDQTVVSCFSSAPAKASLEKMSKIPGVAVIDVDGDNFVRLLRWLQDAGLNLNGNEKTMIGAVLVDISSAARLGEPHLQFIFIHSSEPAYCTAKQFVLTEEMAQQLLRATFGQGT